MSNLAHLTFTVDPTAIEAARIAVVNAVKDSEKNYGIWIKVAEAVKTAWPTSGLLDKSLLTEWIVSALHRSDRDILALAIQEVTDKKARKAAQDKVSQYVKRTVDRAYPAPVIVQPAPELTPEETEARAAQVIATQAAIEKAEAVKAEADAETAKKIAKSEAETANLRAKQAAAAAKLDAKQAEAAVEAQAKAEAAAEAQAKAEADAKQAKAMVEEKKTAMLAAQADANAKNTALRSGKMVEALITEIDAIIAKVQSCKDLIKGSEDLEAALIGARTDLVIANNM